MSTSLTLTLTTSIFMQLSGILVDLCESSVLHLHGPHVNTTEGEVASLSRKKLFFGGLC